MLEDDLCRLRLGLLLRLSMIIDIHVIGDYRKPVIKIKARLMKMSKKVCRDIKDFHPVVIEGMGSYDTRDPNIVTAQLISRLENHWRNNPFVMERIIVTQGDPPAMRGIAAITKLVAEKLGLSRGIIYLDRDIAHNHLREADRENIIFELKYSHLVETIERHRSGIMERILVAVDIELEKKNHRRKHLGKKPLAKYFRKFALLQEVTKIACKFMCKEMSIIHTATYIDEFSVSSFYTVGLELGIISPNDIIDFSD